MRRVIISLDPCVTPSDNVEVLVKVQAEMKGDKDNLVELRNIRIVYAPGSLVVGEFLVEDAIKRIANDAVKASIG